jgi:HNH endonuclease
MHQNLQGASFHLEHVVPTSRGGESDLRNFAWSCPGCNLRKSNRIEVSDPDTGSVVMLFHPRNDSWKDHFAWDDYHLLGRTACGRATVAALDLNHERRVRIRQAEQMFGLFPPEK